MRTNRPDWRHIWHELAQPEQVWSFWTRSPDGELKLANNPEKVVLMHQHSLVPVAILSFPAGTIAMLHEADRRVEIAIYDPDYCTNSVNVRRTTIRSDFFYRNKVQHPFLFTSEMLWPHGDAGAFWDQLANDIERAFRTTVPSERQAEIELVLDAKPEDWIDRHAPRNSPAIGTTARLTRTYSEMLRQHSRQHLDYSLAVPTPVPPSPPASQLKPLRVLFDGVPWQGVLNAREGSNGWIEAMVTGEDGEPVMKDGKPVTERLDGRVELIPDRK